MSSNNTHISQAEHNKEIAKILLSDGNHDWSCIAAFYSALHYIEALFFLDPSIKHTHEKYDKSKQTMRDTDAEMSEHAFREMLIKGKYPAIRTSFHHLFEISMQVRYLENIDKPAYEFIDVDTAKKLINDDLEKISRLATS